MGEIHCHLYFPAADLAGTPFLNRDFTQPRQEREHDSFRSGLPGSTPPQSEPTGANRAVSLSEFAL